MKRKNLKFLPAHVTHLEMNERINFSASAPVGMTLALMRAKNCPVHFYRYLYERVGKAHHWNIRRKQNDDAVAQIIQSNETVLHILYVDGCPAGFAETNLRMMPAVAEILYFGLMVEFQGRGLARFFLADVIANAWDQDPQKLIIQTNTLDSPRALQLYQKLGFEPVRTQEVMVECWADD